MSRGQIEPASVLYGQFRRVHNHEPADQLSHLRSLMEQIEKERQLLPREPYGHFLDRMEELSTQWRKQCFTPFVREATEEDYREWLRGWEEKNGVPFDLRSIPDYIEDELYVATDPLITWPQFGANAYGLIVPENIDIEIKQFAEELREEWILGHSSLFWHKDYQYQGPIIS